MSLRTEHSIRNSKLAKELFAGKKYFDWVITTSFYSAIHIVEERCLPRKIAGNTCDNIGEAMLAYGYRSRHQAREKLVHDSLDLQISIKYKWLDDQSRNARYKTFKIKPQLAKKALEFLDSIQKECAPKK